MIESGESYVILNNPDALLCDRTPVRVVVATARQVVWGEGLQEDPTRVEYPQPVIPVLGHAGQDPLEALVMGTVSRVVGRRELVHRERLENGPEVLVPHTAPEIEDLAVELVVRREIGEILADEALDVTPGRVLEPMTGLVHLPPRDSDAAACWPDLEQGEGVEVDAEPCDQRLSDDLVGVRDRLAGVARHLGHDRDVPWIGTSVVKQAQPADGRLSAPSTCAADEVVVLKPVGHNRISACGVARCGNAGGDERRRLFISSVSW